MDKILVLDSGEIVEDGSSEELSKNKSLFKELLNIQKYYQANQMHKGKEDRNILVWLISHFTKPFKLWIGIAFFTMIIVAAFELLIPINIKQVIRWYS